MMLQPAFKMKTVFLQSRPNESEEDELPYASIHFSQNRPEHASSKIQTAGHHRHGEEVEKADVAYSFVKFNSATPAPRWDAPYL